MRIQYTMDFSSKVKYVKGVLQNKNKIFFVVFVRNAIKREKFYDLPTFEKKYF